MKANLFVLAGVATVLVNACGFTPKEQALGDFDYLAVENNVDLKPAPGKQLSPSTNRFEVPEVTHSSPLGGNVVILAPRLVWPVANGSRVDEDETKVRVYFDELDGMSNVEHYVWNGLLQGAKSRNWTIVDQQEKQSFVIDGLADTFDYGEEDTEVTIERKIKISLETAEHGRTTAVMSEVIASDVESGNEQLDAVYLNHRDNDAAASALNALISEIAITQAKGVAGLDDEGAVNIQAGVDEDGFAAIIVSASFNFTWGIMSDVLSELGFEVDDYNQQTGRYYTTYNAEDTGNPLAFWRDSNEGKVDLVSGQYEIKVTGDRQETSVTLFRNGEAISNAELEQIFAPFAAEIRNQSSL